MKGYQRLWLPAVAAILLTLAVAYASEGSPPHIAVEDPVGANYEPLRNPGLAQVNADHWASGSDGTADDAKHPRWSDYRSILSHYYTNVWLVDGSGNSVVPATRWNALEIDWLTSNTDPPILSPSGSYTVQVVVQNTGFYGLPQGAWALSYKWKRPGHGVWCITLPFIAN